LINSQSVLPTDDQGLQQHSYVIVSTTKLTNNVNVYRDAYYRMVTVTKGHGKKHHYISPQQ